MQEGGYRYEQPGGRFIEGTMRGIDNDIKGSERLDESEAFRVKKD